jgi:cytidyltransferase-like protein
VSSEAGAAAVRVYVDMGGDLFHAGHVALLRTARQLGDQLVVGVLSDATITSYKRRPIMTLQERMEVIGACRYVDEVIADSPFRLTEEFLTRHRIAIVVHGDDMSLDAAQDVYGPAVDAGTFRRIPYTAGISTTELIRRVLESQHEAVPRRRLQHHSDDRVADR